MIRRLFVAAILLLSVGAFASVDVSESSVVVQAGATPTDILAAHELCDYLSQVVGVQIPFVQGISEVRPNAIIVGQGPLAKQLLPYVKWEALAPEQTLIRTVGRAMVVAGGQPRGTLYAAYRLLGVKCGVRWWAPWATMAPKIPDLKFSNLNWTETPAFEYREPYWSHTSDKHWGIRNFNNGSDLQVDEDRGGKTVYQGFVHTYNSLVPPSTYFAIHPEWYSLINGKRTADNAQLCTTNPALRDFVVQQVKKLLTDNPKAAIVSVSQNDCFNPCQCPSCRALATQEGSDAALVLDLANFVADQIKDEFPTVAVDTLAYQWSRHPTKAMKPRANVIVRLCSIECNFAHPLSDPVNSSFGDDIRGWSKLTNRLYVWDYCTNFAHYLQPQPDYFALGQTLKWFSENGVKGVFEEGDYTSTGGDMAELKAWVIAQMLWNPRQDPDALVTEFLKGYYGAAAAVPIGEYLKLMTSEAQTTHVSFALESNALFLRYEVMARAQKLWARAKQVVEPFPIYRARVAMSALSQESVWLARWSEFRAAAQFRGDEWPVDANRQDFASKWLTNTANVMDIAGYPPVTAVDEGGTTPQQFIDHLGPETPLPALHPLPERPTSLPPPLGLPQGIDYQDNLADLWQPPTGADLRTDPLASDGIACWMPGSHHEWGFQVPLSKIPVSGRYKVYVVVRLDHDESDGSAAFSAGLYDGDTKKDYVTKKFNLNEVSDAYKAFELGTFKLTPGMIVWVAPPSNNKVRAVWVDRVYLVKK